MKTYKQNGWVIPKNFKLVPKIPCKEMADVASVIYMPFGDMETAVHTAVHCAPEPPQRPDMREAFEAWMSNDGDWPQVLERSGEGYSFSVASTAWKVWQAAYGGGE